MIHESLPEQWNDREFAHNYLQTADFTVVGRQRSLQILRSFYVHFLAFRKPNTIIDLGCGDGILAHELLQVDDSISAVLIDGSEDMLEQASKRLAEYANVRYVHASFQEIISRNIELPGSDLVASSIAIHHLSADEKGTLFRRIHSNLHDGGYFINIDTVRSAFDAIEKWNLELWREQVFANQPPEGYEVVFDEMLEKYTSDSHYTNVDTLESQMRSLAKAGFSQVDCFYKNGMFAIYGGRRGPRGESDAA